MVCILHIYNCTLEETQHMRGLPVLFEQGHPPLGCFHFLGLYFPLPLLFVSLCLFETRCYELKMPLSPHSFSMTSPTNLYENSHTHAIKM